MTLLYYAAAAAAFVIAAVNIADAGPVAGVLASIAAATLCSATGTLFLSGARRPPTLRLVDGGIVLDLPGVLREPVLVPRPSVRHVYLRDADDRLAELPRRGQGDRPRQPIPINPRVVPYLTFGAFSVPAEWSLLLVVDPPLSFEGRVRRTTVVRTCMAVVFLRQSSGLPGYFTVAHGIACRPEQLADAVNTLFAAGYPITHLPASNAHLDWLAAR